ncbi:hypothetical protein WICPIJ_000770 [Wickerhamomyces pijperi]|uniref:Uncharacterized protein n=1 Tax=Wickerhamomyces pijperi TaxID=599730 RepID=A0A9P8QF44_WICPI|nr:hypothetical protein WICPIJ_000770 [Wickerhamomyces pijperi]
MVQLLDIWEIRDIETNKGVIFKNFVHDSEVFEVVGEIGVNCWSLSFVQVEIVDEIIVVISFIEPEWHRGHTRCIVCLKLLILILLLLLLWITTEIRFTIIHSMAHLDVHWRTKHAHLDRSSTDLTVENAVADKLELVADNSVVACLEDQLGFLTRSMKTDKDQALQTSTSLNGLSRSQPFLPVRSYL